MNDNALAGKRILLAEDEYLIAYDLRDALASAGAEIVGPFATLAETVGCLKEGGAIDAAVLDVNLRGEMIYPAADALTARGVPFLFATGYDQESLPERFATSLRLEKPLGAQNVASVIAPLLERA
jgi:CheY-like chemotaxis protein